MVGFVRNIATHNYKSSQKEHRGKRVTFLLEASDSVAILLGEADFS